MLGLIGIILSLALLIFFAYRGINVLILAPIMALVATLFAAGPLLATYTQVFMPALGKYIVTYFPLFLLGAIFGKLMDDSGAARRIAYSIVDRIGSKQAILAIVLACGILTYGGVSLFVVAFAVFPIAAALFREAKVPKRFIPGAIALGSFTFTMTALPGTPAIQNAIPNPFFGTNAFAAPVLGIIGGLIMFGGGMAWLTMRSRKAMAGGEGYSDGPLMQPGKGGTPIQGADGGPKPDHEIVTDRSNMPPVVLAYLPIVLVIAINFVLVRLVFPRLDFAYLAEDAYGNTDIATVGGIWAIIVALVVAIIVLILTCWKFLESKVKSLNAGTMGSLLPIFNTASEVGYGGVIASLPAFRIVRDAVLAISPNPLVNLAVAVNVLAGITGSASGGMSIALQTLGEQFRTIAEQQNISLEVMHRVTAMASGGFDSLPHNGAVITLLAICGLTHRQSYKDVGIVSLAIPVLATIVVIILGTLFGGF
ncbi:GntP family permease [Granulicoccus sp. GXG6511]|uniref:GntP family permease n=1 Tax=Granulicoccus sp. GXG6511 TaxID=3381351 RepID=UPI003D7DEF9F